MVHNPSEAEIGSTYNQPFFLFPPLLTRDHGIRYLPDLGIDTNSTAMEIWLAALLARMPIGLIAFIDSSGILNKTVLQKPGTMATIKSSLEIIWWRAWAIVATLTSLQLVVMAAAMWYCRTVVVRENSTLVLAQMLRSISEGFYYDVSSIATGEEVARCLGDCKVSYGTVWSGGLPRVDIRREREVEKRFPSGEYD